MDLLEKTTVLRRGAAPPGTRATAWFIGVSCVLHALLLLFFVSRARPSREIAMPASGGPRTRTQLVRLTPLRTFPAPEAAAPEASASRVTTPA